MQVAFNPKDSNTFASACLDKTIKVYYNLFFKYILLLLLLLYRIIKYIFDVIFTIFMVYKYIKIKKIIKTDLVIRFTSC